MTPTGTMFRFSSPRFPTRNSSGRVGPQQSEIEIDVSKFQFILKAHAKIKIKKKLKERGFVHKN